jgi:hypothetical protein
MMNWILDLLCSLAALKYFYDLRVNSNLWVTFVSGMPKDQTIGLNLHNRYCLVDLTLY